MVAEARILLRGFRRDKATPHRRHGAFLADCSSRGLTANGTVYDEPIGHPRMRNHCDMQSRGLGIKVSDDFVVLLCATHHQQLHNTTKEREWWQDER
jgi:hypothetical protein